jgi:hypothetical protein
MSSLDTWASGLLLKGPAPLDLFLDGRVEDEEIVQDEKDQNEGEAGDIAPQERDDRVAQDSEHAAQVKEGEDRVEQLPFPAVIAAESAGRLPPRPAYLPTTVAERMVIGSTGTSPWPRLLVVGTLAMASTTSIPATTLPKTQ